MKEIFAIMGGSVDESSGDGISPIQLGRGLLLSCSLVALFSLALAAAYCFTSLSGSTAHLLQLAVLGVAVFAGAFAAAKGGRTTGPLARTVVGCSAFGVAASGQCGWADGWRHIHFRFVGERLVAVYGWWPGRSFGSGLNNNIRKFVSTTRQEAKNLL